MQREFNQKEKINTVIMNEAEAGAIEKAADILKSGGLVAFPTETVYGLGGNALSPDAAAKIYAAKGRPSDNPLIVHIADTAAVYELAEDVSEKARYLMEAFWPGPLTIIFKKKNIVPPETTGGLGTVAIRMPSHTAALAMIKASGLYIAAPSANLSGRPSPTMASHVTEDLSGRIDMILDGGPVGIGIESTIIDMSTDTPTILRPGYITKNMLEAIIGPVEIDKALICPDPQLRPRAPGMKYTHYAPQGSLTIVESHASPDNSPSADISCPDSDASGSLNTPSGSVKNQVPQAVVDKINELVKEKETAGKRTAVLTTMDNMDKYECRHILLLGDRAEGTTVASHLYAKLRECDDLGIEYIYSEAFDRDELGYAIMNRLLKAAGQSVIRV